MMDDSVITGLRQRYVGYYGEEPATPDAIAYLEAALDLEIPSDMKAIATFYSGGFLGGISHYSFASTQLETNIVARNTLRFRSAIDLPHRFIVLAEPDESLIVLDVDSGVVTWCDNFDVCRLDGNNEMLGKPDTWPSYAEFFEYLLDEEGEERRRTSCRS